MGGMKATKAKPMKAGSALTVAGAYSAVAEQNGLKPKEVKAAIEALYDVGAAELKKHGKFKIGGLLNMKLKVKAATPARKGVNPFTKEPCVFKAKPASKTEGVAHEEVEGDDQLSRRHTEDARKDCFGRS